MEWAHRRNEIAIETKVIPAFDALSVASNTSLRGEHIGILVKGVFMMVGLLEVPERGESPSGPPTKGTGIVGEERFHLRRSGANVFETLDGEQRLRFWLQCAAPAMAHEKSPPLGWLAR